MRWGVWLFISNYSLCGLLYSLLWENLFFCVIRVDLMRIATQCFDLGRVFVGCWQFRCSGFDLDRWQCSVMSSISDFLHAGLRARWYQWFLVFFYCYFLVQVLVVEEDLWCSLLCYSLLLMLVDGVNYLICSKELWFFFLHCHFFLIITLDTKCCTIAKVSSYSMQVNECPVSCRLVNIILVILHRHAQGWFPRTLRAFCLMQMDSFTVSKMCFICCD